MKEIEVDTGAKALVYGVVACGTFILFPRRPPSSRPALSLSCYQSTPSNTCLLAYSSLSFIQFSGWPKPSPRTSQLGSLPWHLQQSPSMALQHLTQHPYPSQLNTPKNPKKKTVETKWLEILSHFPRPLLLHAINRPRCLNPRHSPHNNRHRPLQRSPIRLRVDNERMFPNNSSGSTSSRSSNRHFRTSYTYDHLSRSFRRGKWNLRRGKLS